MEFKKILPLAVVVVLVIVAGVYLQGGLGAGAPVVQSSEDISQSVAYIINKGDGSPVRYNIDDVPADATVFSLLNKLAQENHFAITKTDYPGMGVLVNSIAGLKGGTDNKWWQYWINGVLGDVAADKKPVHKGDKVIWKFEAISF